MAESNVALTATIAAVTAALGFGLGQMNSAHEENMTSVNVAQELAALDIDSATLPISGSPAMGAHNPKATVVVFTDFKAPANAQLYKEYLEKVLAVNGNDVAIVYKSFPLKQNPDSQIRAKAAMAAHLQGKFWEMAKGLNDLPVNKNFDENAALAIATQIPGLDAVKLLSDMNSEQVTAMIQKDIELGTKLNVTAAPSVFVNGHPVSFKKNINQDELLAAVNSEIQLMDGILNAPAGNYYLSSLVNNELPSGDMTDSLGRPARGAKNPLVTIVEYSDYECPFCSRVEPTLAKIMEEYPNDVRIVFNHNPLPFHKNARLAHQAAYAASKQGKFWEMHDLLFKNQKKLTEQDLISYAGQLKLNVEKFKADLKAPETVAAIDKALKDGEAHGISGTPNFLINGEPLTGAQPYEKFKEVIDNNIKKAQALQAKTGLKGEALYQELLKSAPKPKPKQAAQEKAPEGKIFVDVSGAPVFGDPNAPVTIVEFTDFECPFCSRGNNTVKELISKNPGKVKLVFKNNPLSFHKHADAAHRAAEAAAMQGKFWEMYNKLFENQKKLEQADIEGYAEEIGLDMEKFKADMESEVVKSRIAADLKQGASVGVRGTPHFFMNGTRISGAQPLEKFQASLDEELKIADKYIKRGVAAEDLYKTIIEKEPKPAPDAAAAPAPAAPKAPIVMNQGKSFAKGPADAPVVIYQFSEFQCPFCSRVEPTIEQIEKTYGDKVRIVFKNFPLPFHNNAALASEAALAAGAQNPDKFWEMHDILFKNQKALERDNLIAYAGEIGLDVEKFTADLDNHTFKAQVDQEVSEGKGAGVSGTPSFVVNGKLVVGALPFDSFKTEIDAALAAKK